MEPSSQYEQDRLKHLEALRALGVDPYGHSLRDANLQVCANIGWESLDFGTVNGKMALVPRKDRTPDNGPHAAGVGRVILHRDMGNLHFLTVRDESGDVQIALNKKRLPERDWKTAKLLDLGDLVYFEGRCAPTQKGEPTLWAEKFTITTKSLAPPPSKAEGLTDVELRYRRRYTDLWSNPEVMKVFKMRSQIIHVLRAQLFERQYMEVETPMLQTIAGGAVAKPFTTHHNALDIPLFMRIAPELFLKRLLVGGVPRVYEIGRNFRNEGLSPRHNPEFTALEAYEAYSDHEQMADFVEVMIRKADAAIRPTKERFFRDDKPWRRVKVVDLVTDFMAKNAMAVASQEPAYFHHIFEHHVEHTILEPTFVTHLPATSVPLAKHDGHGYALCFELVANGQEIGCGYTEQNDPLVQLDVFTAQHERAIDDAVETAETGHALNAVVGAMDDNKIDNDFIDALKVGMPPAGGIGIGIDRLVMWLTGAGSIRDVILFPTMKPTE